MAINVDGELGPGVTSKDLILAVIAKIGTGGGQGYVLEYRGKAIEKLSMEARMTICNMSIEAGARRDDRPRRITYDYLKGRDHAPKGEDWDAAAAYWDSLRTDPDAQFDAEVHIDASALTPFVTWGTNPGQGAPQGSGSRSARSSRTRRSHRPRRRRWTTWAWNREPRCGTSRSTRSSSAPAPNGRIEDLRARGRRESSKGRRVADGMRMLIVPGSMRVRAQAERKVWARSSPPRAPNGARRDARCAWA